MKNQRSIGTGEMIAALLVVILIGIGIVMISSSASSTGNTTGTDSSLQSTAIAGQDIPAPINYVTDTAGVLKSGTVTDLDVRLESLSNSGKGEAAVLVVPSLNGLSIEEYGIRVAEAWKVGKYGQDNGVILIISTGDRKVRIETGSGSSITDGQAAQIISDSIVPSLKKNDWDGGVTNGVDAIIKAITK